MQGDRPVGKGTFDTHALNAAGLLAALAAPAVDVGAQLPVQSKLLASNH